MTRVQSRTSKVGLDDPGRGSVLSGRKEGKKTQEVAAEKESGSGGDGEPEPGEGGEKWRYLETSEAQ